MRDAPVTTPLARSPSKRRARDLPLSWHGRCSPPFVIRGGRSVVHIARDGEARTGWPSPRPRGSTMSTGTTFRAWMAGVMVAVAAAASVGCTSAPERAASAKEIPKPSLLINLTSGKEDPHAVTMALMLATRSQQAGRPTIVFFNVHAPPLAARDLPDSVALPGEAPVKKLLADFIRSKGRVYVCSHCLGVAGMKNEDLVDGAQPNRRRAAPRAARPRHDRAVVLTRSSHGRPRGLESRRGRSVSTQRSPCAHGWWRRAARPRAGSARRTR